MQYWQQELAGWLQPMTPAWVDALRVFCVIQLIGGWQKGIQAPWLPTRAYARNRLGGAGPAIFGGCWPGFLSAQSYCRYIEHDQKLRMSLSKFSWDVCCWDPGQVLTFLEFPLDVFIHESFMNGPSDTVDASAPHKVLELQWSSLIRSVLCHQTYYYSRKFSLKTKIGTN